MLIVHRPLPYSARRSFVSSTAAATAAHASSATSPTNTSSLSPAQLRWRCDPAQFVSFETTAELDVNTTQLLGQARAQQAIEFGISVRRDGYNLYVLGPSGSGKRTTVRKYLEQRSADEPVPPDWCYVHNFDDNAGDKPKALSLPFGMGILLEKDLQQLIAQLKVEIPAALESEEHRARCKMAHKEVFRQQEEALDEFVQQAQARNLTVITTESGVVLMGPKNVEELPPEEKEAVKEVFQEMEPVLHEIIQKLPHLRKLALEKVEELNREAGKAVVESLLAPLQKFYADQAPVLVHLEAVAADVIKRADQFRSPDDGQQDASASFLSALQQRGHQASFDRYLVNLIVNNNNTEGAPVIYEDHPFYHNLMGSVQYKSSLGSLETDFSLIKAGALHRANGGYLVMNARDVLLQPGAVWEALKRAVRTGEVKIESLAAELSLISTVSLQPEPIPLDVKIVLLGDRLLYYMLQAYDPDFEELFKVAADFNDEMDRSEEACQLYARMLATLAQAEETRPMDRQAVAAMIEQSARHVGDQEKLSTHMRSCTDLLRESDYWAGVEGASIIGAEHVRKAIDQQIYRADRLQKLVQEQIRRGTLLVDVRGERIGQVNGLSVVVLGRLAFGRPSRITATARPGRGKVVDIEREVELGGSTHSKGVMILSSLLASRYARDCPMSLSASLVFEQSYGMVDGDSASMAELCALLSALSEVSIKQGLAITGSVNQHGGAQAIGGATEKIEGFYDVCSTTGLTGEQGVLIPASNAKHLMLRPDVVEAVEQKKFAVYTYENVDDAIALLTGIPAGERDRDSGAYPPDTVNFLVDRRLHELADILREFAEKSNGKDEEE